MSAWLWRYPYGSGATAQVLFNDSPADASYRWVPPYDDCPQPAQALVRTADRTLLAYKLGEEQRVFTLRFEDLPDGNAGTASQLRGYLGVKAFLVTHVDFSIQEFGFYDHAGSAEVPVRFLDWSLGLHGGDQSPRSGQIRLIEAV